jgi:hypothetical protein
MLLIALVGKCFDKLLISLGPSVFCAPLVIFIYHSSQPVGLNF